MSTKYLAIDLGASSGRVVMGELKNKKISLYEIHRFYNGMTYLLGSYYWDIFRLYDEIKKGLSKCADENHKINSIGIDTWGVDYALLDKKGNFLGIPYAYRDHRTDTAIEEVFKIIPGERIYQLTGIQFLQFNTLFQLYAAKRDKLPILDIADSLLFVPDIFNYMLSGVKKTEFTFATTSQLYNPNTGKWEKELFDAIGIPINIMQEIVKPGTVIGKLLPDVAKETKLGEINIVAPATHDTGSAIAAIPAEHEDFVYISSGTWSLMGIESKKPLISDITLKYNFTNEGGVENTFRFLKNIMGLWLIQECKRIWDSFKKEYSYTEIVEMAKISKPFRSLIDPDDNNFYNPGNMPEAIVEYCKKTKQPIPESPGEFARCIFESLALKYRYTLDCLKDISGRDFKTIHIIGGGSQNKLLCQFTADATGLEVVSGPAEGTAIGNIMVQAMAMGEVSSLSEIRRIIKNSFDFETYKPQNTDEWEKAYEFFKSLLK